MARRIHKLVAWSAAVVGVVVAAVAAARLAAFASPSDNVIAVQRDSSWLDYLPSVEGERAIEVASLTKLSPGDRNARRIDLLVRKDESSIALCFARSEADLAAVCPGAQSLGLMDRDVEQPWVGQLGTTSVDLLDLYRGPAPSLDQATSIKS